MRNFDVLIVGTGVLGLSMAHALALEDPNLNIGLIGPLAQPGMATTAAGAMLGCFGEITKTGFNSTPGRAKLEINIQAAKLWPEWLQQLNEATADTKNFTLIKPGTFVILNSRSGTLDSENYDAILEALDTYNEPYEKVDPSTILGVNAIADSRPIRSLYLPNEGSIDPNQLLSHLRLIAERTKNITLVDNIVKKISISSGKINGVMTETDEEIKAESIILAAGAYSQFLIDQIEEIKNRIPRLFSGVGCAILAETSEPIPTSVVRTPNRSLACGLHLVPRDKNTFYVGATNSIGILPETEAPVGYTHFLIQCLIEQINQNVHNAKIKKLITGNRPVAMDTYPLIGETSIKGLWMLTGTYRDGIHCSPLLAQSMARQIVGKTPLFNNVFSPERMPIQTLNQEEALIEITNHYMAGGYEHSMKLPKIGWDIMFKEMLYTKFEKLYKDLALDFVLPPDLLLMFEQDREKHIEFFQKNNELIKAAHKNQGINKQKHTLTHS